MARGCPWFSAIPPLLTMIKVEEPQSGLMAQAEQIAGEFSLSAEQVRRVTKHLVRQLSE